MNKSDIIEVTNIQIIEKDVIEIKKEKDFDDIHKILFNGAKIFKLNKTYYLIGTDVIYTYKED